MPYYFKNSSNSDGYTLYAYESDQNSVNSLRSITEKLSLESKLMDSETSLKTKIKKISLTEEEYNRLNKFSENEPLILTKGFDDPQHMVEEAIENASQELRNPYDSTVWTDKGNDYGFSLTLENKKTNRFNHGIAHSVGVTHNVKPLWLLYNRYYSEVFQYGDFNSDKIPLIQMAMMYTVSGRRNEVGWRKIPAELSQKIDEIKHEVFPDVVDPESDLIISSYKEYMINKKISQLSDDQIKTLDKALDIIRKFRKNDSWIRDDINFIKDYSKLFKDNNELYEEIKIIAHGEPNCLINEVYAEYPDLFLEHYDKYVIDIGKDLRKTTSSLILENRIDKKNLGHEEFQKNLRNALLKKNNLFLMNDIKVEARLEFLNQHTYSRFRESSANNYRNFCEKLENNPAYYNKYESEFKNLYLAIRYMGDPSYQVKLTNQESDITKRYCSFISRLHDSDLNRCFGEGNKNHFDEILEDLDPLKQDPLIRQDVADLHLYFAACQEARGDRIQERYFADGESYPHAGGNSYGAHFIDCNNSAIFCQSYLGKVQQPFSEVDDLYDVNLQKSLPPVDKIYFPKKMKANEPDQVEIQFNDKDVLIKFIEVLSQKSNKDFSSELQQFAINFLEEKIEKRGEYYGISIPHALYMNQLERYLRYTLQAPKTHSMDHELFNDSDELSAITSITHCQALHKAINVTYDENKKEFKSQFYFAQQENPMTMRPIPRRRLNGFNNTYWEPIYDRHQGKTYRLHARTGAQIERKDLKKIRGSRKPKIYTAKHSHQLLAPTAKLTYNYKFGSFGVVSNIADVKIKQEYIYEYDFDSDRRIHIPRNNKLEYGKYSGYPNPKTLEELQQELIREQNNPMLDSLGWSELLIGSTKTATQAFSSPINTPLNRIMTAFHSAYQRAVRGYDLPVLIINGIDPPAIYTETKFFEDIKRVFTQIKEYVELIFPEQVRSQDILQILTSLNPDDYNFDQEENDVLKLFQSLIKHLKSKPYFLKDEDISFLIKSSNDRNSTTIFDQVMEKNLELVQKTNLMCGVTRAEHWLVEKWDSFNENQKNNFIRKQDKFGNLKQLLSTSDNLINEGLKLFHEKRYCPEWFKQIALCLLTTDKRNMVNKELLNHLFPTANFQTLEVILRNDIAELNAKIEEMLNSHDFLNPDFFKNIFLLRINIDENIDYPVDKIVLHNELTDIYVDRLLAKKLEKFTSVSASNDADESLLYFLPKINFVKNALVVSSILCSNNNVFKSELFKIAVDKQHLDTINALLLHTEMINMLIDRNLFEPLFTQIINSKYPVLIEKALFWSLRQPDIKWLNMVLPKIIDPNITDSLDRSPAYLATIYNNWGAVEKIIEHPNFNAALLEVKGAEMIFLAAKESQFDIVQKLIVKGADIKTTVMDSEYNSVLSYALLSKNNDIAELFFQNTTDPNILNNVLRIVMVNKAPNILDMLGKFKNITRDPIYKILLDMNFKDRQQIIRQFIGASGEQASHSSLGGLKELAQGFYIELLNHHDVYLLHDLNLFEEMSAYDREIILDKVIRTSGDFCRIFLNTKSDIFDRIKVFLPDIIKTAQDFENIISVLYLPSYMEEVYKILKNILPNLIQTARDFSTISNKLTLTSTQSIELYQAISDKLVDLIKTGEDFNLVCAPLSSKHRVALFDSLKANLAQLIKKTADIKLILSCFNDTEQCIAFLDIIKESFPEMVINSIHLSELLKNVTLNQFNAVYQTFEKKLPNIIRSPDDLVTVLKILDYNLWPVMLYRVKDLLPNIINTFYDLDMLLKRDYYLHFVCEALADKLPSIITNVDQLNKVFYLSHPNQCILILNSLTDKLPEIIKTFEDLRKMLECLPTNKSSLLMAKMNKNLSSIIKSHDILQYILSYLAMENRVDFLNGIKNQLPDFINTPQEFIMVIDCLPLTTKSFLDMLITSLLDNHSALNYAENYNLHGLFVSSKENEKQSVDQLKAAIQNDSPIDTNLTEALPKELRNKVEKLLVISKSVERIKAHSNYRPNR